ncbi:hypothetical protein Lal_00012945 [Lupinus albus]|nr:hypothetical protein Lal_00012945 [Lupinus albus]
MASKPGILTDWPWKPLGSFKFQLISQKDNNLNPGVECKNLDPLLYRRESSTARDRDMCHFKNINGLDF